MATLTEPLLKEHLEETVPFEVDGQVQRVSFETRVDPLSGAVTKISRLRAARSIGIAADLTIRPVAHCAFCHYEEETPKARIHHASGCVSVPNKFPWERYDWITIYPPYGQHKLLLSQLYFEDLEYMVESSYDLAVRCAADPKVIGFMDFTNWGAFAGASQQHPHSQRKSITNVLDPRQSRELDLCKALWERHGVNPFDLYREEERQRGVRMIHDDDVFVAAAFAPTTPHEVIVFPNEDVAHIVQTTPSERKRLVRPALGVFPALFFYLGVTDLNIITHMAPFHDMEAARNYYRWHMHILPRRSRLPIDKAGAELGFDVNVIDTLPETTAEIIRRWYSEGPREELLAKVNGTDPSPLLVSEFRRLHR
jgi:galactose-1-phosphate uridylyltransferase